MDPVSAFGLVSGAFQIAQIALQTAQSLTTLRGKFENADLTIWSLIGELRTIRSALIQLGDWAQFNSRDSLSPVFNDGDEGLNVALEGCSVIMDVLSREVAALAQGTEEGTVVGFRVRARAVWNEGIMRDHQDRLHAQVLALQLLLQACQCRTSSEQVQLLRKVENRQIIRKAAEDTATLRSRRSQYANSHAATSSLSVVQSSVGETVFDFDDTVMASPAYQHALRHVRSRSEQLSIAAYSEPTDEGYSTGMANTPNASIPSRPPSIQQPLPIHPHKSVSSDFVRRKTVPIRPNTWALNQIDVRRWQSDSTPTSLGTRSSGSRSEKVRSFLRRISTSGSVKPRASGTAIDSVGGRSRGRDFNISIDLKTANGASAPLIVKAAQAGARIEVERLIQSNHDIEARHIASRRNALMVAAHCGNEEVVDLLIQNNARLDVADGSGSTALHLAASRGHVGVLELLLVENVDVEARNTHGRTALWVAADHGQLDATRMLLAMHAKVNSRADNQMTAVHAAAKRGDKEIIELLISQGADLEAKDAALMTALHYACEECHLDAIETLLNSKMNINAPGSDKRTPLICAAAMGKLSAVELLLKKKASSRCIDEAGMTSLHWAAFNGHTEIVSLLDQKKGLSAMTNIAGRTALHLSVMNSQFAVVELLLRKEDVSLEARCDSGLTPLHYACIANNVEITRLLLTAGSDIEAQTGGDQRTPVHIAAAGGSMALLNLLCDKGASLDARDALGDRALCVACRQGHAAAVQNILNRGSSLYQKFGNRLHEDSPLCLAAMGGHLPVVSLLLQHGASISRSDETGWQPARYAAYHGHPDVLQLLLINSPASSNAGLDPELTADNIGFAPHVMIPEERKKKVRELLGQAQRGPLSIESAPAPVPRDLPLPPAAPAAYKPFKLVLPSSQNGARNVAINEDRTSPQELPGTLEQGLPNSRSVTPDQMRGEVRDQETDWWATTGIQGPVTGMRERGRVSQPSHVHMQEPVFIQQPQPRAVSATTNPWFNSMQAQATVPRGSSGGSARTQQPLSDPGLGGTPSFVSPQPTPVSVLADDTQDMSRRLLDLLRNEPSRNNNDDNERSETSSMTTVYTAPERSDTPNMVYELPA
ncbi:ankyrin repeat protein [Aspergillus chevalieri]|uniref:Ankyrin repeat protein n=1 Tax=Aspergillus chevalieri TaxID=182096 RepID=A0A7R7VQM9_ASPCH|nr:uncharacterized protein ACHE_50238A [Aspergillus chevalieri]BCR89040.1 hypothetical protein ACHE_50238A [Aspergillus chevalieri]